MKLQLVGLLMVLIVAFRFASPAGGSLLPRQASEDVVYIFTPQTGQAVQGIVPVEVSLIVSRLEAAMIEFRYAGHPTETWFLIAQVTESIPDGVIAEWDTTTITDGVYELRLSAITKEQERLEFVVLDIRVRNYSAIETDTPTPFVPTETLLPGQVAVTPTYTRTPPPPTVTPHPTNPAILTMGQFSQALTLGVWVSLGFFVVLGLYILVRASLLRRF